MIRSIALLATLGAAAAVSLDCSSSAKAADFGYRQGGVEISRPSRVVQRRTSDRRIRRYHQEDFGVFYPYRTYWDRYPNRYYHDRYAYGAEPFPNGFWWW